jgi:NAD(P)-dependent dehydrogenase (short-subunit alcohol dehydrogenase family)
MLENFPFRRNARAEGGYPPFHPQRLLCDWDNGDGMRISDAVTGVAVFGATGSGKTSGIGRQIAHAYLAAGFGGLVLCAKSDECRQWQAWAAETGRTDDLIIVDPGGAARFNWMDYEANRSGAGAGLAINIVAMLDELGGVAAGDAGGAEGSDGAAKFFRDSLHHLNTNAVDLALLAGLRVSLPLLRSIILSAPLTLAEAASETWQQGRGVCATLLREAGKAIEEGSDAEAKADLVEVENYWLREYPAIGDRTRSIITLCFSMMARPFLTRPLRKLFSADTNVTPEAAFDGKIIIVDLPVQVFRLAGRMANLAWKYCFQIAVMRRQPPSDPDRYLRPVFLFADEAQNFTTDFDAEYQAVARAAGGCTVYLTQNRESYLRVLGNEAAVDSLLGNLQLKAFCQQSSPATNAWAARLLGERWQKILSTNVGQSGRSTEERYASSNVSVSQQKRHFVEPAEFTVLQRGGAPNDFQVEVVLYLGGHVFKDGLPFRRIRIDQRTGRASVDER